MPVLDEEARIAARLAELVASRFHELIVVDGGSRDRTVELARAHAGVRVLVTARGRGQQMNAGAREATGEVLLFVHADAQLPADAGAWIERTLAVPDVVAGAFRLHTVADVGRNWLGPFLRIADIRSHVTRVPYGDQALFVRRAAFEAVGGFPDVPLMEDIELAQRLRGVGRLVVVPAYVRVSGRRFLQHPIAGTLAMWTFPTLHRLGVPPRLLARLYGNPR
ncbi:MAG TPA: TIGR04283 family arsenosugar biosynthesis glycosyltransferase [Candidatus Eisenbacteria bacterium]|nr:TIGR04283 family arsenosugar biosynthesis glycosyltransferase [Candidatus Eisenbacteria bacterium]